MKGSTPAPTRYWLHAAVWLVAAAVHLLLLWRLPRTVLGAYGLTDLEQAALATVELLLLAGVIAAFALVQGYASRVSEARSTPSWLFKAARALRGGLLAFGVCFYATSWLMFRSLGSYLDGEGLRFVGMNPKLLLQHFVEINLAGMGAGLLLGSGALVAIVTYAPSRARGVRPSTQLGVLQAAAVCFALAGSLVLTIAGTVWFNRNETRVNAGMPMRALALVQGTLGTRAGPLSHLLVGALAPQKILPIDIPSSHGAPQTSGKGYAQSVPPGPRPNVIVIVIEALRDDAWRQVSPEPVMPHLQALARSSVVFDRAYSHANHSDYAAPCVVSSQYPLREQRHHYYAVNPPFPRVMLYDVLKGIGYRTAIVSSQNEHWGEMANFLQTPGLDLLFHSETFLDDSRKVVDAEDGGFLRWTVNFGRSGKIDDGDTMSEAISWVGRDEQAFFLSMNLQNSHFPYRFPPEHDRFRPSAVDFPYTYNNYPIAKNHVVKNRYYNALHYADAQLGRLLQALGPKLEDTLLVVTGDHGEAFFEHGFGQHGSELFEETIRVPLVMHLPGQAPRAVGGVASHVDVAPTVLAALGLPQHPAMQGKNLLEPIEPERAAYVTVQTPVRWDLAVITRRYKLVTSGALEHPRLVDLQRDPAELENLAPSEPALVEAMTQRLKRYRDAQLTYYHDVARMRDEYPPRIE
jgi:arylsulfatase A-like enzyme